MNDLKFSETLSDSKTDREIQERASGCASVSGYVAVLECSAGNETVGDMWTETHVCGQNTTIAELMNWKAKHPNGKRLSITKAT